MSAEKYPRCTATLKNGSPCQSVVFSIRSDDELHRLYCQHHAQQAAAALEPPVEDEPAVEDTVEAVPLEQDAADVVTVARGTPRETIREFALANPHLVDEFLKGVLAAEQAVWVSCPHCKKRSPVPAPNWSARTKAVELLLEQGFGRPEPAPPDDDEKLRAAVREGIASLSEQHLLEVAGLQDFQRRLLSLPMDVQLGLSEADDDELVALAETRVAIT